MSTRWWNFSTHKTKINHYPTLLFTVLRYKVNFSWWEKYLRSIFFYNNSDSKLIKSTNLIWINELVFKRVSSIHDNSCFDKMCIWHYTASWCEQCLNYCIEMLSKQKKLPRLNPQGRQSSPDQLWKDRERAATVWLQASFLRRQADIETKVNKLNALAHLLTTLICLPIAGSGHSLSSTLFTFGDTLIHNNFNLLF